MIFKIILFGLVIWAAYYFIKKNFGQKEISKKRGDKKIEGEIMLECSKCGTFMTDKDSFIKDGKFFCSKECMEA